MRYFGLSAFLLVACGGGGGTGKTTTQTATNTPEEKPATEEEIKAATKPCGEADKVHMVNLHDDQPDEALVPCAEGQKNGDYSGLIKLESVEGGVHITIDARDDEVTLLGSDVKSRDAVIVFPKGKNKEGVEVPLMKTKTGYHGDKIVFWDQIEKLTDEGTKLDVAIFDHDKSSGKSSEEMHVTLAVSTGKSCEKAIDENPNTMDFNKKGGGGKDLTDAQLSAPINGGGVISGCLPGSSNADICVAIKQGKPLGVSVTVTPTNNKIAACIDRKVRHVSWPASPKLDVIKTHF